MSIVQLVAKADKPETDVTEILEWLERTKERVKEDRVTSIAIAWATEDGNTGTGYIAYQPQLLLGAILLVQRQILDSSIE